MAEIESIVRKKKNWIARKQNEYVKREYNITKPTYKVDSTLPYLGKNIPIRIKTNSATEDSIELVDGEFQVLFLERRLQRKLGNCTNSG